MCSLHGRLVIYNPNISRHSMENRSTVNYLHKLFRSLYTPINFEHPHASLRLDVEAYISFNYSTITQACGSSRVYKITNLKQPED